MTELKMFRTILPMKTRLAPVIAALAVAMTVLLLVGFFYRSEHQRRMQKERLDLFHQLNTISAQLETSLLVRTDISNHLAAQVAANPDIGKKEFEAVARELISHHSGILCVQLARNSVVSRVYPITGNEAALGLRLLDLPGQRAAVRRAIDTGQTVVAGPLDLVQGGAAIISRTPIFPGPPGKQTKRERYWGLATVIIEKDALLRDAGLLNAAAPALHVAIRGRDGLGASGEVFFGDSGVFKQDPVVVTVTLPGGSWQIAAAPKDGTRSFERSLLWIWLGGGLLALSAGGLTFFILRKPAQLRELLDQYRNVEHSLRLSEEKYRAVVENANESIVVTQDSMFRFVNPRLTGILGYSREELLIRPFAGFIHPADRDLVMKRHGERLSGENPPSAYDVRIIGKGGSIKWFEMNSVRISWEGKPAALTFLNDIDGRKEAEETIRQAKDSLEKRVEERTAELQTINEQLRTEIAERKKIEQELKISESHFRSLLENAQDSVVYRFMADEASPFGASVLLVSPSAREILGMVDPYRIEAWFSNIHPEDRRRVTDSHSRAWTTGLPFDEQFRWFNPLKNKWIWVHTKSTPVRDARGKVAFYNGLVFDITARKRAKESLQQSERKYRSISQEFHALLDGIADALIHIAPDLSVRWANKAAAAAVGRETVDMIGGRCYELWHGRSSPCEECPVTECLQTGMPAQGKKTTPDGRWWEVKAYPIRDEAGKVISSIEIAADITERVKWRTEAARTRQLVSLGELAAGVAHEINNPLAGITLCFQELMQSDIDGPARETLRAVIDAELVKIKNIVDQLLTFSRMNVTDRSPANINKLIANILLLCRYQFSAKNISIVTDLAAAVPDVIIEENKIEQVFMNIILNALHAMPEGGRLAIRTGQDRECCIVSFSDTGPGIPAALLPRIFEPFFTTRKAGEGTGLGLSISKEIVEQHDGVIEVENSVGHGTTFTVRLPFSG